MKFLYILFFITIFKSDSSIQQNNLQIEIINKEIYFIETLEGTQRYQNYLEKEKSYNLIEVKFMNNSNKKVLLFLNPNKLNFYSSNFPLNKKVYCAYGYVIESIDQKAQHASSILSNFLNFPQGLDNMENYNDSLKKSKYEYIGLQEQAYNAYELYEQNSLILGVNEIKALYFSLNLPIVAEINANILQNPIIYKNLKEDMKFRIEYQSNANYIYEDLPNFVKKELKENNIEIFDGVLYSNEVSLKKR